jgi:magnesium-transporting ATPase (P-type)
MVEAATTLSHGDGDPRRPTAASASASPATIVGEMPMHTTQDPVTEVAHRQARDGPNVLRATAVRSAFRRLLLLLADPLVVLLTAAAAIAFGAWMVEGRHGWPIDTSVILLVVLFNTVIGWWQQRRADQAVAALAKLTAATVCSAFRVRNSWSATCCCWPQAMPWAPTRAWSALLRCSCWRLH